MVRFSKAMKYYDLIYAALSKIRANRAQRLSEEKWRTLLRQQIHSEEHILGVRAKEMYISSSNEN